MFRNREEPIDIGSHSNNIPVGSDFEFSRFEGL